MESTGSVTTVTLDRPEVRNALNRALIDGLREVVEGSRARVLILRGNGPAFCAGGDLQWMREAAAQSPEENARDALQLARLFDAILRSPAVVIGLIHGACFGGGCGLAAAVDVGITTPDAKFCFSEVKLGLVPATISTFVVPKIGAGHARELFTTGRVFDGRHAAQIGLVQHVAEEVESQQEILNAVVKSVLSNGPEAVRVAKQIAQTPPASLALAADLLAQVRATPEGQEGTAAFLEKRAAAYVERWNA